MTATAAVIVKMKLGTIQMVSVQNIVNWLEQYDMTWQNGSMLIA